ncbi:MAG: molybdopterin-dependent oxidoreductase [Chloroflexota bacterium]|nr:molybdopterin-dependent oxidoreductase [Chloroflexota bacterium]
MSLPTDSPAAPPSRTGAAIAGMVAGGAALGFSELLAGLVAGAPSLIIAVGGLIIALQPPGAKQFVVDLVGEADKLLLNVLIAVVALAAAGILGIVARTRPRVAAAGFGAGGAIALYAALQDPLVDPLLSLLTVLSSVALALWVLRALLRMAVRAQPAAEMPDWSRRRFIGSSLAVAGVALGSGLIGRTLLSTGRGSQGTALAPIPKPVETASPLPPGASLDLGGVSPIVIPNRDFYRIDTALLVPRPNIGSWRLRVDGMVDHPFELTYDQLLAMPLHEEYVTIACVSNEVGGRLVGNALWRGVRLRELLERAGVQAGATQIVGRSVDGWTSGFPTAWALASEREPLLAVGMNGEPLPAEHGYPARLIIPGLYGYVANTKWLAQIELTTLEAFDAYWIPLGWAKLGPILTQSRIDTPSSGSELTAGNVPVAGVAWAPDRGVSRVEVQVDDGAWSAAELSTPISAATWVQFVYRWQAAAGQHVVRVRATDGNGETQTGDRTPPPPDGARGYHSVAVSVT